MAVWGVWAWISFALACVFSLFVTLLVPGLNRRRYWVALAARASFILAGVGVSVRGLENLPSEDSVVVANHASYVDGVLLKGFLPARFDFVIKGEVRRIPIVHFLLRRAGSRFVERKDVVGSTRDARQLVKAAKIGGSLGFFPEGTFHEAVGVRRFRPGAFVAAVQGGMPVVPIAISGTRAMLPAGRVLPRRTHLNIDILPSIGPGHAAHKDSRLLAEASRQEILAALGEPDLQ